MMNKADLLLKLDDFFGHHMILQRDKPIRIFGRAPRGSSVAVELAGLKGSGKVSLRGSWEIELPPLPAGGPHSLLVRCGRDQVRLRDIYLGDLWFCSGQSNMEFPLSRSLGAASAIKKAALPLIRHFKVERNAAARPASPVKGEWKVCSPSTAGEFTAVGFYFAREIHSKTGVPIGLIHSSWGGTPIEAWLPPAAYKKRAPLRKVLAREKRLAGSGALLKRMFRDWERKNVSRDPGNKGERKGWARPDWDDRSWGKLKVPGFWEGQGLAIDGAVWFRCEVKIPAAWKGRDLQWNLGTLDDFDESYFNGVKVGSTGKEVENAHRVERSYRVPARLVEGGKTILAVRIFDQFGSGGFTGGEDMLYLSCPSRPQDKALSLAGGWRYAIEWSVPRPSPVPQPPALPEPRARPSRLYLGMVHRLSRAPIRGFLWYQGESNACRAAHYRKSFPALIESWREAWGDDELPFYFVQLANFKSKPEMPGDDCWAELREAQASVLKLKKTGMAVAIDLGEEADIHPRNKEQVGRRLALLALAGDYGKKAECRGPRLLRASLDTGNVVLEFEGVGEGLRSSSGREVGGFALAGRKGKWVWAEAKISGKSKVILRAEGISKVLAVRYAWATNPEATLLNSHGLPAEPFRTDQWKLSTEGAIWPC